MPFLELIIPIGLVFIGILIGLLTIKLVPERWLNTGLFEPVSIVGKTYFLFFPIMFFTGLAILDDTDLSSVQHKLRAFQFLFIAFNFLVIERMIYLLWIRNTNKTYPFKWVLISYLAILLTGLLLVNL